MRNAVFIFLDKTSGRKYIKTIALVSFQHLLRTLPVSYQNDLCDHLFYMHQAMFCLVNIHGVRFRFRTAQFAPHDFIENSGKCPLFLD